MNRIDLPLELNPPRYAALEAVAGRHLPPPPTARQLVSSMPPLRCNEECRVVLARLLADDRLYALPVVDAELRPVALIDRRRFVEFFSRRYVSEIYGRRPVDTIFDHPDYGCASPLVVDAACSIDDAAQIVLGAGLDHMVTGFVVAANGRYLGVANGHDLLNLITQRKQAELYHLANYDYLTGTPNRMLLTDRLDQACREARRKHTQVALLFVDVDRFKQINDALGHGAGDTVLCRIAERLRACARAIDTVARLGGDEFVILMEDLADAEDADRVAQRVLDAMEVPLELPGGPLVVSVSIGAALFPSDDQQSSPLLAKADAAMYQAKRGGRNTFRRYRADAGIYNPERVSLEGELRRGIESGEFSLVYQPQVELRNRRLIGVEALVRWQHPTRGAISPAHFIPAAEESGLIVPLGEQIIRMALQQSVRWRDSGVPPLVISINISAVQLRQRDLAGFLAAELAASGADPHCIELELTESMLMSDADGTLQTLERIRALGLRLAVDDFGTGFSSLSYLQRFPLDRLKVDQSFVRDVDRHPANESIARAIVALAGSLKLDVVAEGIETEAEEAVIAGIGASIGQGYLYARPMPAADLQSWQYARAMLKVSDDLFDAVVPTDVGPAANAG